MPPLPQGDYKIIIRPRGGLRVADHGAARLATSIYHAAEIPRETQDENTMCLNSQQNIIVVSTPIEAHADKYQKISRITIGNQTYDTSAYEAAPDFTSKGVIRDVPLEDYARDITANIITSKNPTAIAAKRLSNTTTVMSCSPVSAYQRHRADVCPNPNDRLCRGCGAANPPQDHQCKPTCQLCGDNHQTADKACKARYKTPYLVKRRQWERERQQQQHEDCPTDPTPDKNSLEQRDPDPFRKPRGRVSETVIGPRQRSARPSRHTALPREGVGDSSRQISDEGGDCGRGGFTPGEFTEEYGWKTASSKRSSAVAGRVNHHVSTSSQAGHCSSGAPSMKAGGYKLKNRIVRASRMPPVPKEHIKIVIRPRGGLNITKTGPTVIGRAIVEAAGLNSSETNEDVICPNYQQNIMVASTPERHNADKYSRIGLIQIGGKDFKVSAYETAPHST
ncbi:hypothetical protein HPB52_011104 [Rhipicephalus sanguineus]|uniref:Uncharacterized protein n=1 Tax=Rhipicephalus sanguineus TaxID=34632 RepID=A0A9D4Q0F6_RHISA|nr:hypothetical protein HPB52_011104 [Rhipicephalus sanguineus]